MFYAQSTAKGHIVAKQNVFLPHYNSDSLLTTYSTVEDFDKFGENEVE